MVLDAVVERFVEHSPLGLQRALDPAWIDELFEQERETQYTRELLFSTTVEIMSLVAVGLRPSVHAAAKASPVLPVSITALYDKISRTEPGRVRALVQGSARRRGSVVQPMLRKQPPSVDGYRLRIVDGSHLPASEKRLKPLRGFRGAALPWQSLVVYDPDTAMIVDLLPAERLPLQLVAAAARGATSACCRVSVACSASNRRPGVVTWHLVKAPRAHQAP